jgi:hypothetical protein
MKPLLILSLSLVLVGCSEQTQLNIPTKTNSAATTTTNLPTLGDMRISSRGDGTYFVEQYLYWWGGHGNEWLVLSNNIPNLESAKRIVTERISFLKREDLRTQITLVQEYKITNYIK